MIQQIDTVNVQSGPQWSEEAKPGVGRPIAESAPYKDLADIAFRAGVYAEALRHYNQALITDPRDAMSWNCRGVVLYRSRRYSEALASIVEALALNPKDPTFWINRGTLLVLLGRYEEAMLTYDHALTIDPKSTHALLRKGAALYFLNKYTEAVATYDICLAIDSQLGPTWCIRGNALWRLRKFPEARDSYDKALRSGFQFDPGSQLALQLAAMAIGLADQDIVGWFHLGKSFEDRGRGWEAFVCYATAATLDPRNATDWRVRGDAFDKLGRKAEADASRKKADDFKAKEA